MADFGIHLDDPRLQAVADKMTSRAGSFVKATSAQVAITEASIRERNADVTELSGEGLYAMEIRPIGIGYPGAKTQVSGVVITKPVSRASPDYFFTEAFQLRSQGRFKQAIELLSTGIRNHPGTFRLLLNRGYLKHKLGQHIAALKDFLAALDVLQSQVSGLTGTEYTPLVRPEHVEGDEADSINEDNEAAAMITARMTGRPMTARRPPTAPTTGRRPGTARPTIKVTTQPAAVPMTAKDLKDRTKAVTEKNKLKTGSNAASLVAAAGAALLGSVADQLASTASALHICRIAQIVTRYNAAIVSLVSNIRCPFYSSRIIRHHVAPTCFSQTCTSSL
jgi:tetratricopeptide (TPR) repeat protein